MRSVWHLASGLNDFFSKNKNNNKNSSKIYIIFRLDYNYFFYGEKRNSLFKEISVENLHRWAKIGFVIPCCKTVNFETNKEKRNDICLLYCLSLFTTCSNSTSNTGLCRNSTLYSMIDQARELCCPHKPYRE